MGTAKKYWEQLSLHIYFITIGGEGGERMKKKASPVLTNVFYCPGMGQWGERSIQSEGKPEYFHH